MPLPQLANRADVLSKMLARGYRPHSDYSPNFVQSTPTPVAEVHWNDVSQTLGASRSDWPTGHEVPNHQYYSMEKAATLQRPASVWERLTTRFSRRKIIGILIVVTILLIILAVLLAVLLRKKSGLPNCPAGTTGTDCDIGMFISPLYAPTLTSCPPTVQLRAACVSADHRACAWPRGCLTYFQRRTRPST